MTGAETAVRAGGLLATTCGAIALLWLFTHQPANIAQLTGGVAATVGAYEIDREQFDQGRALFLADRFIEARAAFARADPATRDAVTQFYVAYSYYRQGWGRVSNVDALFKSGLETMGRIDPNFRSVDANLQMKTAAELKFELEEGLKLTASDFNPLKLTKERK